MSLSLLLLLLLVCSSQASHFYGTVMTYYPKNTNSAGSITVVLRYKLNFRLCTHDDTWSCSSGNCGTESSLVLNEVSESDGEWCQREGIMTRQILSNAPFQLLLNSTNWISNIINGIIDWRAVTLVELRNRSDTGRANRSPQTTILPAVRVPSNCPRDFNLLAFDPDGDEVKCRYGNDTLSECNPCTPPAVLSLSSSCVLSFSPNSAVGPYAVQLVMEDFPRQNIILTATSGLQEVKTTHNAISKIPVQFVLRVDSPVPNCIEGLFLPKFLPPTPDNGARLYTPVNQMLEISISAVAINSAISELLFSGPHNIQRTSQSVAGQYILRWTPSESEDGESHPICFVIQAVSNSVKYHSELRCVIVTVGNEPIVTTTIQPTTTQETDTTTTRSTTESTVPSTTPETTPDTTTTRSTAESTVPSTTPETTPDTTTTRSTVPSTTPETTPDTTTTRSTAESTVPSTTPETTPDTTTTRSTVPSTTPETTPDTTTTRSTVPSTTPETTPDTTTTTSTVPSTTPETTPDTTTTRSTTESTVPSTTPETTPDTTTTRSTTESTVPSTTPQTTPDTTTTRSTVPSTTPETTPDTTTTRSTTESTVPSTTPETTPDTTTTRSTVPSTTPETTPDTTTTRSTTESTVPSTTPETTPDTTTTRSTTESTVPSTTPETTPDTTTTRSTTESTVPSTTPETTPDTTTTRSTTESTVPSTTPETTPDTTTTRSTTESTVPSTTPETTPDTTTTRSTTESTVPSTTPETTPDTTTTRSTTESTVPSTTPETTPDTTTTRSTVPSTTPETTPDTTTTRSTTESTVPSTTPETTPDTTTTRSTTESTVPSTTPETTPDTTTTRSTVPSTTPETTPDTTTRRSTVPSTTPETTPDTTTTRSTTESTVPSTTPETTPDTTTRRSTVPSTTPETTPDTTTRRSTTESTVPSTTPETTPDTTTTRSTVPSTTPETTPDTTTRRSTVPSTTPETTPDTTTTRSTVPSTTPETTPDTTTTRNTVPSTAVNSLNTTTIIEVLNQIVVGLRVRISSSFLLSEDNIRNTIIQQLKDVLVKQGLPANISLRLVVIRYKLNFHLCTHFDTWSCFSGNCGTESPVVLNKVYTESSGDWCQREGVMNRQVSSNSPFQLLLDGGNWINTIVNGIVQWRAVTLVELRNRSDTGRANKSPQTTVLPAVRVPSNCHRDFNLLAFDPDGDEVKCRYGNTALSECNPCTPPSVLNLSSSCSLSFSGSNSSSQGPYAVQLVMEDFPRQTVTLTQTNGAQTTITTNNALSKLPVQFVLRVDPPVPSCTDGLYLPKFLPPTPVNRARLYTPVNQTLEISINAEANISTISELLFSGPYNVNQTTSGPGQFVLTWTPFEDQDGESHPICFVVQAVYNSVKYHSELRCVIVSVGNEPSSNETLATTPETSPASNQIVIGLRVRISSLYPLSDDDIRNTIIQQLNDRLGLPSDTLSFVKRV